MFGKNKKTSLAGLGSVLAAIADILMGLSSDTHVISWQMDISSIIVGLGLLFAKDANVTGGTVMQPSSTKALMEKRTEEHSPEVVDVLSGTVKADTAPIPKDDV